MKIRNEIISEKHEMQFDVEINALLFFALCIIYGKTTENLCRI